MRGHGNLQKRLADTRSELRRLRASLRVVEEQVAYAREVADEATTRALVASTPLADRERRDAAEDLRRVARERDELHERVAALLAEQDELLERLAAHVRPYQP